MEKTLPNRATASLASAVGNARSGVRGISSWVLSWPPSLRFALVAFTFTLLYKWAKPHVIDSGLRDLPTALGLAFLLRAGPRSLPGYAVGVFAGMAALGVSWPEACFAGLSALAVVALAWPLCGGVAPGASLFSTGDGVARYLLAILPVVSLAHAAVALLDAAIFAELPVENGIRLVFQVLRRDVVTLVILTPALVLLRLPREAVPTLRLVEAAGAIAIAVFAFHWEFTDYDHRQSGLSPVALLPVILLVWSAQRASPTVTALVIAGCFVGASWGLSESDAASRLALPWYILAVPFLYLVGLGVIALVTFAVRNEQSELSSSEGRFQHLVESLKVIPWEASAGSDAFSWIGPQAERLLGYPRNDWLEPGFWASKILPEDRDEAIRRCTELAQVQDDYEFEYRMCAADGRVLWVSDLVSIDRSDPHDVRLRGVLLDISERKEQELAILEAEQKAWAASQAKSDFLAVMNHELRTPLNAVVLGTELLLESRLDGAQRAHAETIRRSSGVLLDQIRATLDLSRIEAGRMELKPVLVDLQGFLLDLEVIAGPLVTQSGLRFSIDATHAPSEGLFVDRRRLRQILLNLVGNAVKFTDAGEVCVRLRWKDTGAQEVELCFDVIDTGIGVPETERARIFEPFEQLDGTATRRHGGSGLGLTISQRLVGLMGGTVNYLPREGGGSCFRVRVPAQRQAPVTIAAQPPRDVAIQTSENAC